MSNHSNPSNSPNPQLLQQRLSVREQEINALKIQNRHLLERIEELEKKAEPNRIDTRFVADEVNRALDPVLQQMKSTVNSSFEILQSTMRGIYQQSQRAEKAVSDMSSQTRELEIRLNDQRKQDQTYYQDRILSIVSGFCDRLERQIDIRLRALGSIELVIGKQNEILSDLETLKSVVESAQRNTEAGRADVGRVEKGFGGIQEQLVEIQLNVRSAGELVKDTLQQAQSHRAEIRMIRAELKQTVDLNRDDSVIAPESIL